jgi:hypothetical protein
MPGDFDQDGDVDGRDFLWWQRNTSVGALGGWQENYGEEEELSALSGSDSDSGDATPGLEDDVAFFVAAPANLSVRCSLATEDNIDLYVEEVDRAIEQFTPVPNSVRSFGEMVARRGVRRLSR